MFDRKMLEMLRPATEVEAMSSIESFNIVPLSSSLLEKCVDLFMPLINKAKV